MSSDSSRSIVMGSAFEFGETELLQLEAMLSEIAPCKVELETKDGATLKYDSMKDALAFPNVTEREVVSVRLVGQRAPSNVVNARLGTQGTHDEGGEAPLGREPRLHRNVQISFSGEDQAMFLLSKNLKAWFAEQQPWWHWVAEHPFPAAPVGAVFAAIVVLLHLFGFKSIGSFDRSVGDLVGLFFLCWIGMGMAVGFVFGVVLERPIQLLFPLGAFTFGFGKKRCELRSSIRNVTLTTVFIGVILAFAVNVAASYFGPAGATPTAQAASVPDAGVVAGDAGQPKHDAGR